MSNPVDSLHTVEEIAPRTWRIDEAGMANCYLLEAATRRC